MLRFVAMLVILVGASTAAARTIYVTPDGGAGAVEGTRIEATTFEIAISQARPGDILQLIPSATSSTGVAVFTRPLLVARIYGSPEQPITVRGLGARTVLQGTKIDELRKAGARAASRDPGFERPANPLRAMAPPPRPTTRIGGVDFFSLGDQMDLKTCLAVEDASWIVFEDLTFRDCWLPGIHITGGQYITLRRSVIHGSSYVVAAFNSPRSQSHHFLIEDNFWVQDTSGFNDSSTPGCAADPGDGDCPGLMWHTIPWGVIHHGSYEHFNGALFGAIDIVGTVVFRGNTIRNAYNGIRLLARGCGPIECNLNVEVYDNTFAYVRDNPVEMEHWGYNWWIHDNRIINNHAWFSTDGMGGGPVFIFHNTAWFNDIPGRACQDKWASDRRYDWYRREWMTASISESECVRSRRGTVVKVGAPDPGASYRYPNAPIYLFNNSWFLRSPLAAGGDTRYLKHWNNAIAYCRPGSPLAQEGLCAAMPVPLDGPFSEPHCRKTGRFWTELSVLFLDCFGSHSTYSFDYDISDAGFPSALLEQGHELHGLAASPGFIDAERGDFRLEEESPARGTGCTVAPDLTGVLQCGAGPSSPNRGAVQPVRGLRPPPYKHVFPQGAAALTYYEHPRVVRTEWGDAAGARAKLALWFSVPVQAEGHDVKLMLTHAGQSESGQHCVLSANGYALSCDFSRELASIPFSEMTIGIPRDLVSRATMAGSRRAVTVWGSYPRSVTFATP